jgi:ribonuclease T2
MIRFVRDALIAGALAASGAASAQPVPANLETPHIELPPADQPPRMVPIVGYTLALIWTPQHCFHAVGGAEALQCGRDTGAGFVLHGLWPDGEGKSWPQWCGNAPVLPRKTIADHYRATPSPQLLQHEWAKHGTCIAGATPDTYFGQSNRLFFALRFPDMEALAKTPLTEAQFAAAFAAANPGTTAESVRLNLDKQGWLQEVWLCLDTSYRAMRCAAPAQPARAMHIRS